jgi:hypothetical protein
MENADVWSRILTHAYKNLNLSSKTGDKWPTQKEDIHNQEGGKGELTMPSSFLLYLFVTIVELPNCPTGPALSADFIKVGRLKRELKIKEG